MGIKERSVIRFLKEEVGLEIKRVPVKKGIYTAKLDGTKYVMLLENVEKQEEPLKTWTKLKVKRASEMLGREFLVLNEGRTSLQSSVTQLELGIDSFDMDDMKEVKNNISRFAEKENIPNFGCGKFKYRLTSYIKAEINSGSRVGTQLA